MSEHHHSELTFQKRSKIREIITSDRAISPEPMRELGFHREEKDRTDEVSVSGWVRPEGQSLFRDLSSGPCSK